MALATANYFLKWLSRLIPIKRSDALTATLRNDSGSKESVNQQQRRELPLPLFINSSEMFIFSLWGLTPKSFYPLQHLPEKPLKRLPHWGLTPMWSLLCKNMDSLVYRNVS